MKFGIKILVIALLAFGVVACNQQTSEVPKSIVPTPYTWI